MPWNHLPLVAAEDPTQGYLATYVDLWRPPEQLQKAWLEQYQTVGPLPFEDWTEGDRLWRIRIRVALVRTPAQAARRRFWLAMLGFAAAAALVPFS